MKRIILSVLVGVFLATSTITYASYQGDGSDGLTRRQILYYTKLDARKVCELVAKDRGNDAYIVCQGRKRIKEICLVGIRFYFSEVPSAFEGACAR